MQHRVVYGDMVNLPTFTRVEPDDTRVLTCPVSKEGLIEMFDDGSEQNTGDFIVAHDFVAMPGEAIGIFFPSRFDGITKLQMGDTYMFVNFAYMDLLKIIAGEQTHVQLSY